MIWVDMICWDASSGSVSTIFIDDAESKSAFDTER